MKIAVCISGYFSNKVNDDLNKLNLIHQNIINNIDNCDIFIHSFDIKNKDNILKKYPNIKKYIIEAQIDFRKNLTDDNLLFEKSLNQQIFPSPVSLFSSLSFMYSRKKAIMLAINNEIKYDIIIWCRFDNGIRLKLPLSKCNPTKLIINNIKEIDNNYIYMSWWEHLHSGYSDHWFISNLENMKKIALMYDSLYNYYKINSEFDKYSIKLSKIFNNDGFRGNNHTVHKFYFENNNITANNIKYLTFYGN